MNPTFKQVTKTRYVQLVSELAQEIFVQHYTKLTPKVAAALADKYQSDILTDDEIHSGVINYFLIYLGTEPAGYFALDLGPAGAMCLSRLFLKEKARGQGIGRSIVAYAQKLAEGDVLAQRALEIEHVAVLALEVHIASAGVDDLAEFFDFFDVLEFHVHCLPCNFLL